MYQYKKNKVDLYSRCASDATSNTMLRWRSDTIAKSLLFCRVATIVFSSGCLVILIIFFFMISDGNYSATVAISLES